MSLYQPIVVLLLLATGTTVPGCKGGSDQSTRSSGSDGGDDGAIAEADEGGDDGFEKTDDSTPIAGINLTYDTGRVRCDYEKATPGVYDVACAAVVVQPDGREVEATSAEPGLGIKWEPPTFPAGTAEAEGCEERDDQLAMRCRYRVISDSKAASVRMPLKLTKPNSMVTRSEVATVVLPYAVNVAVGLVPNIPFAYQQGRRSSAADSGDDDVDPESGTAHGFQPVGMARTALAFAGIGAACFRGDELFFAQSAYIYRLKGDTVTLWAGSTRSAGAKTDLSHRFRIGLGSPLLALICDKDGLVVADSSNHRILKLRDSGTVEVLAGTGVAGVASDGAAAALAKIKDPMGLARDRTGRLYFSDSGNHAVRRINGDGTLTTFATGLTTPAGLVFDDAGTTLFVADLAAHRIFKVDGTGMLSLVAGTGVQAVPLTYQTSGSATTAPLVSPLQLARDEAGTLYFSEVSVGVRSVSPSGQIGGVALVGQLTVDGTATTTDSLFFGLAVDGDGAVHFGWEQGFARSTGLDLATTLIGVLPGTGTAGCTSAVQPATARLNFASALTFDKDGHLVLADWADASGGSDVLIKRLAPDGALASAPLGLKTLFGCTTDALLTGDRASSGDYGVGTMATLPNGDLLFANALKHQIIRLTPSTGTVSVFAGTGVAGGDGDGGTATAATLNGPVALAVTSDGSVLVAEELGARLRKISSGGVISTIAGTGIAGSDGDGGAALVAKLSPSSVAVTPDGIIYVSDLAHRIRRIDVDGTIETIAGTGAPGQTGDGGPAATALLNAPRSVVVTRDHTVYFIDGLEGGGQMPVVRRLVPQEDGSFQIETFFGDGDNRDCATGRVTGKTGDAAGEMSASLGVMCSGKPYRLALSDGCQTASGKLRLALAQGFNEYSNVVEIERACGD